MEYQMNQHHIFANVLVNHWVNHGHNASAESIGDCAYHLVSFPQLFRCPILSKACEVSRENSL